MSDDQNPSAPRIHVTDTNSPLTSGIRNRPSQPRFKRQTSILAAVVGLAILGLLGLFIRSQLQIKALQKSLAQQQSNPNAQAEDEQKQLIAEVGKLIILPGDETPTIATVNDLTKLKDQPFFANAQIGDKVLIYSKAQKAYLFRPSEHKIIEIAPLSSDSTPATSATTSAPASGTTPAQ